MGLDGRPRPGQRLPEQSSTRSSWEASPAPTRPPTAFPSPGKEVFSKSVSWNKIKCEVQSGVQGSLGGGGGVRGMWWQPAAGAADLSQAPPRTAELGSPPSGTFHWFQDDPQSWPHGRLMPVPRSR